MIAYRFISIRKSECFFSGRENLSFKLTTASIERVSVGGKSGRGDPLLMIILFSSLFPTLPLFFAPELFLSLAWVNFKLAIGCPCSYLLEKSENIRPYSILCLRLCSFSLLSYKVTQLRLYFIIFLVQVVLKRKGLASNPRSFGCEAPLRTNATLFLFLVNPSS